jgi:Restriction endonuclease
MVIQGAERDTTFKKELAQYIDINQLDISGLLERIRQEHHYTALGAGFKSLARNQVRRSALQLWRELELASSSDEAALWFLTYVLDLIPHASSGGKVEFQKLPPAAKGRFVSALDQAAELGNKVSAEDLASAEVEYVCCSEGPTAHRIGKFSNSRLGDLLLGGSDEEIAFVLDQLDKLHVRKKTSYDSCYAQLLQARLSAHSTKVRLRIGKVIRRIERDNPSATLPILGRDIFIDIQSGSDPVKRFNIGLQSRALFPKDVCALALGVAEALDESGKREAATQILGLASQHAGSDSKLRAWVGIALGDTVNAARALFDYGLKAERGHPMFDRTERLHAVEAACRLLFRTEAPLARIEYQLQADRYRSGGKNDLAYNIQTWQDALEGFQQYLGPRIQRARKEKAKALQQGEVRMSLRYAAELNFLLGANGNFQSHLKRGTLCFEKASVGIEAPWIEGERLMLKAVRESLPALRARQTGKEWSEKLSSIEEDFVKAGDLLESPYPLAVSLAFRGISKSCESVPPESIRDITLSIEMLHAKTPELLELRKRIESTRWSIIEALGARTSIGSHAVLHKWLKIASLIPILSSVIDEDLRLRQHFSPALRLELSTQQGHSLPRLVSVSDPNERGRLLEDFVVAIVNSSRGLRVVDVRHRNNYEEIDIIVSVISYNPLLSYWGPLLLIECKNWNSKVGTEPVRAFYTKMTAKKGAVRLGVIISPFGFTKGVQELSRVLQDALIIAIGPNELEQATAPGGSFVSTLEKLIPETLFG